MRWRTVLLSSMALLLAASVLMGCGSKPQPTATPESILPADTSTEAAIAALASAETPADTPVATLVPPETPTPTMTLIAVMATYEKPTETPTPTLVPPEPPTPTWTAMPMTPTPTLVPPEPPTPTWTAMPLVPPLPLLCSFEPEGEFAALWQIYKRQLRCPLYPTPKTIQDAEQVFDNGRMFWRQDNRHIYVVYEKGALSGTYQVFLDEWEEGDPEYSCAGTPPADRLQPKRGFGLVWCNLGGPAAAIGWGLEEEAGFWAGKGDPLVHDFGSGVIFRDSAGTVGGTAYMLLSKTSTFLHVTY